MGMIQLVGWTKLMQKTNIFSNIPKKLDEELFEDIISNDKLKIQKIVSEGHTTDKFEWYDQDSDEWVIVLHGEAILSFENEDDVNLKPGDYINIPAHKKHRVSWTTSDKKTIWLAVHH